jgi:hypothetical protein
MELSFLAKSDLLVAVPGTAQFAGQLARYVGREWEDARHAYVASAEPYKVDSESGDGRRLSKLMRREDSLLPGDQATAEYFGLAFVTRQNVEGEWVSAAPAVKEVRAAKKGND